MMRHESNDQIENGISRRVVAAGHQWPCRQRGSPSRRAGAGPGAGRDTRRATGAAASPRVGLRRAPTTTILIAFSQGTMNHPWRVAMVEGNQTYAAENYPNVELVVTDGQNQARKQVSDVESLLVRQPKVLVISPLTAEALTPVVERALAEGIPVVTLDRMVDTCVSVHVGAENLPIGRQAAAFLGETPRR